MGNENIGYTEYFLPLIRQYFRYSRYSIIAGRSTILRLHRDKRDEATSCNHRYPHEDTDAIAHTRGSVCREREGNEWPPR